MVPPYPFCIEEDRHDVPMEDCWYASPQLFFTCVLRSKDGRLPKNRTYKTGPDDIVYTLVFFSTFEELKLPFKGPMEDAGGIKLYEPSPTHCLYVADVQNMVGRVPLMPLFLAGNPTPTIPHIFSKRKDSDFPYGCADTAATDGRQGSNVYEVNPWLWQFGRCTPRLGGLTIEETIDHPTYLLVAATRHTWSRRNKCIIMSEATGLAKSGLLVSSSRAIGSTGSARKRLGARLLRCLGDKFALECCRQR